MYYTLYIFIKDTNIHKWASTTVAQISKVSK